MNTRLITLLLVTLQLSACSSLIATQDAPVVATPPTVVDVKPKIIERPFPDDSFFDLLVAEFAVRRQHYNVALNNYLKQAQETRDIGVVSRATRLAQYLRMDQAALSAAKLWVEIEPNNIEAQFSLASLLAKYKQPLQAFQHMTIVMKKGGKPNFAAIASNTQHLPVADHQRLEKQFDELLVLYPRSAELIIGKALLLQQGKDYEQALSFTQQALAINQDNLHAVVTEARLLQQLNRDDEALKRLKGIIKKHPQNQRLRLQYARLLMNSDVNEANNQFVALLESNPDDPDLLLALALINKEQNKLEETKQYFQQLLSIKKHDAQAHYHLGQIAEIEQDWNKALDHYLQIPPNKNFFQVITRITSVYLQKNQLAEASQYLQSLRQQYPKHAVRLYILEAEALMSTNQLELGHQLLSSALEQHPAQPSLLYTRSVFSEKRSDLALMEQDLQQLIELNPNNAMALNALGYTLANHSDRYDEAYQYINRALSLKPDSPAILDSLGWVEYKRGNLKQALELLQKAYLNFPDHEVAAHLGEVMWQLNQHQQAQEIWQQGLEQRPDSKIILKTIQRLYAPSTLEQQ